MAADVHRGKEQVRTKQVNGNVSLSPKGPAQTMLYHGEEQARRVSDQGLGNLVWLRRGMYAHRVLTRSPPIGRRHLVKLAILSQPCNGALDQVARRIYVKRMGKHSNVK